jgi:hypothetical protein
MDRKKDKHSSNGRRGPNAKTKKDMVKEMPKNFFRKEHEKKGFNITFANAYDRKNGCIYIQYSLLGSRKKYWAPRSKTAWLDEKGLEYAQNVARRWKEANQNSIGHIEAVPSFYLQHRKEFIKFLYNTARHTTIEGYENALIQYVFPYFVGKLELNHPKKWNQDVVRQWDAILEKFIPKASSRNRKRTALRRYFEFLYKKNLIKTIPLIVGEPVVRETDETPIPGDLPTWTDVVEWFRRMPKGRYRFVRAVSCAFGLRISEAMAVKYEDFLGARDIEDLAARGGFYEMLIEEKAGVLYLNVDKADKKQVNKELVSLIGERQDSEPKSRRYTACCTSEEMGLLIYEMIESGEHEEPLSRDDIYRIKSTIQKDDSSFRFHKYNPHDDRRLNITLQCLDLQKKIPDVVEVVCMLHGQNSREVFKKYFQWGLTQRRKVRKSTGEKLELIRTK